MRHRVRIPGGRLAAGLVVISLAVAACQDGGDRPETTATVSPGATGAVTTPAAPTTGTTTAPAAAHQAGRSTPVADPVYPAYGNPAVDVLHYGLVLRWQPSTRVLSGAATLTIRAAKPTDTIQLDLARPLQVDGVTLDGKPVTPARRADDLVIPAGRRLAPDTTVTVVIRYHGRPQPVVGPSVRPDAKTIGLVVRPDGSAFALQEPFGALSWYPVNDQPSDKALYDVAVTVPRGWAGVSSGVLRKLSTAGADTSYSWHAAEPIASYLVAFCIDRYRRYPATGPRGIPVTYWVRPQDAGNALKVFGKTPRMLTWLEARFGPYPFASAGVVGIREPTGMETQTMVTVGVGIPEPDLLHEFAHQWFGNTVSPRTWLDMWLNEGFAMYAQLLYEVDQLGASKTRTLARWRQLDGELRTEHGPPGRYKPGHFASPNVYLGPALMLEEIRKQIGDKKFLAMMRAWAQEHRNGNADRQAFVSWLNRYTGRNLTSLVNRWLDSPTTPG